MSFEDVASDDDLGLAAADDPAEAFDSCVLLRALALAVAQLPERERRVVGRHYYEGARLKDIGAELGVSEPRISQILSRAIARLRGALAGGTGGGSAPQERGSPPSLTGEVPQRESGPARPGSSQGALAANPGADAGADGTRLRLLQDEHGAAADRAADERPPDQGAA